MQYVLNAVQAKKIDSISINNVGIPSMVLMERAALAVADAVEKHIKKSGMGTQKAKRKFRILSVCGSGNNGADAVAAARILYERGYNAEVFAVKREGTEEFEKQLSIARASKVRIINRAKFGEYNIIIDGLFGIGLSRNVEGLYAQIINGINESDAWVLSVDIPSGINASDGRIMSTAVKADKTVTFGYTKIGNVLYPGAEYAGKVKTADAGFAKKAVKSIRNKAFTYSAEDLCLIPKRKAHSNKGTYGKVLVIAGSASMGGAASLAALAAYRSGAGLVKVLTHENQRTAVQKNVPEAIVETYGDGITQTEINEIMKNALSWATCVIIGPGISTSDTASWMTEYILRNSTVTTVLDADALNLIAQKKEFKELLKDGVTFIVTPHLGEMARLTGTSVPVIQGKLIETAGKFAKKYNVVCVLKDARTIVAAPSGDIYVNTSGNSGMATGGSGDVLTGVIAGMKVSGLDTFDAACVGVLLHGLGGDHAAEKRGEHGMKAGDIIDGITNVMSVSGMEQK